MEMIFNTLELSVQIPLPLLYLALMSGCVCMNLACMCTHSNTLLKGTCLDHWDHMIFVWFAFPGCREGPAILCPWLLNPRVQTPVVHVTQAGVLPWDFENILKKYVHLSLLPALSREPLKIREEMLTYPGMQRLESCVPMWCCYTASLGKSGRHGVR